MPPPKKVPKTDAIFEQLKVVNPEADRAVDTLRISIDAKATVHVGPFSRRGRSRTKTEAADHDFKPEATLTPFGIFLPEHDDLLTCSPQAGPADMRVILALVVRCGSLVAAVTILFF